MVFYQNKYPETNWNVYTLFSTFKLTVTWKDKESVNFKNFGFVLFLGESILSLDLISLSPSDVSD